MIIIYGLSTFNVPLHATESNLIHFNINQLIGRSLRCRLFTSLFVYHRVEDHDDIMRIFAEQTKLLSVIDQPYILAELIEAQNEENHAAVCEVRSNFELSPYLKHIESHVFV